MALPSRIDREHPVAAALPCWECGFNLSALPGNRCPECGAEFDRDQLALRLSPDARARALRRMVAACLALGLAGVLFACLVALSVRSSVIQSAERADDDLYASRGGEYWYTNGHDASYTNAVTVAPLVTCLAFQILVAVVFFSWLRKEHIPGSRWDKVACLGMVQAFFVVFAWICGHAIAGFD